jgi:hypothetical protein
MAAPRLPNAPREYSQLSLQQIVQVIQLSLEELDRRGVFVETQLTVGVAGSAAALPATPAGYTRAIVAGEEVLIPYYAMP